MRYTVYTVWVVYTNYVLLLITYVFNNNEMILYVHLRTLYVTYLIVVPMRIHRMHYTRERISFLGIASV